MVIIKQLKGYQNYLSTINKMEQIVDGIKNNNDKNEYIWLLEHENVFTAGSSSNIKNLEFIKETPVITTNRGGQMTYHGPGQLVIYFMINIKIRKIGLIEFINKIEMRSFFSKSARISTASSTSRVVIKLINLDLGIKLKISSLLSSLR